MKSYMGFFIAIVILTGLLVSQATSQQDQTQPQVQTPSQPQPLPQTQDQTPPPPQMPGVQPNRGPRRLGEGFRDPAQLRQSRLDRIKENLEATDDQWKTIEPKLNKVQMLQMQQRRGMIPMPGRRPPVMPGTESAAMDLAAKTADLQKVLDDKEAKPDALKAALQALRDAREKSRKELADAQKDLAGACTERQQARLVLMGILE
jgi:hypothetical protein